MNEQRKWACCQIIFSEIKYREMKYGKKRFKDMEYEEGKYISTITEFYRGMIAVKLDGKEVCQKTVYRYLYCKEEAGNKFDSFIKSSLKVLGIKQDVMDNMVDKCLKYRVENKKTKISEKVYVEKIRTPLTEYEDSLKTLRERGTLKNICNICDRVLSSLIDLNSGDLEDIKEITKKYGLDRGELFNLYNHYSKLTDRTKNLWTQRFLGNNNEDIKEQISKKRIYLRNVKYCEELRTLLDMAYLYDYKKKGQEETLELQPLLAKKQKINMDWLYIIVAFMLCTDIQKRALIDLTIQNLYLKN